MKKVLLSLGIVASLFASDKVLSQSEALNIIKQTPVYAQLKAKLNKGIKVKGLDKKDLYVITLYNKRGEQNIFVTKDLKYTILGMVLNNKTKRPVVAIYPPEPFKGDKKIVKDGVVFSMGKGSEDIYIVTDPECPWCRKFEKMAKNTHFADKYKIHIIFLPLPFHKHAKDMIYYILSAKSESEKAKRFHETLTGDDSWKTFKLSSKEKEKIDKELLKSQKAVEELGAKGTPSFYDKNMKEIVNKGKLFK